MARLDTRSKIIDAALELFATNGYTTTTTKLIADAAGVNEVTIFRHFGNKEALFQEVIRDYVENHEFMSKLSKYKQLSPAEAIRTIGREYIDFCYETKGIYRIQMKIQDELQGPSRMRLSKTFISGLTVYLTWLQSEGIIHTDPEIIATNFVLSILGVFTFYILTDEFTDEYVKTLVNAQIEAFIDFHQLK